MDHNISIPVSSTIDSPPYLQKAQLLAERLGVPFVRNINASGSQIMLAYTAEGLSLVTRQGKSNRLKTLLRPDFITGKVGYRLSHNQTIQQPLARAAGIKPGFRPTVLDGTAGVGVDGFILAMLGCTVTMCERSPLMYALLADALLRADHSEELSHVISRITLHHTPTHEFLISTTVQFDTIYLDPMYPHRNKNALNQEFMRTIRKIVGDDLDAGELFCRCRQSAGNRVVVKRPKGAENISDESPDHVIKMKNSRFDVYLQHNPR